MSESHKCKYFEPYSIDPTLLAWQEWGTIATHMRHHSVQSKQLCTWTDTNSSMTIIQCTFTCIFIYTYVGKHAHSVSVSMQTCVHILRKVCTISNFCADVYTYSVCVTVPYSGKYAHSVSHCLLKTHDNTMQHILLTV